MTDEQDKQEQIEHPISINALGPEKAAEQVEETRRFANNVEAFDAKQAESLAAQSAPNPTTDAALAEEAYGKDWNKRRGHKVVGADSDGNALFAHGGVVVDSAGHALGHVTNAPDAVALKDSLGTDGEVGRYPITAEAQAAELRERNESGKSGDETNTLDGGLGAAVDGREQNAHDEQVTAKRARTPKN
jgi:hypothetical protein